MPEIHIKKKKHTPWGLLLLALALIALVGWGIAEALDDDVDVEDAYTAQIASDDDVEGFMAIYNDAKNEAMRSYDRAMDEYPAYGQLRPDDGAQASAWSDDEGAWRDDEGEGAVDYVFNRSLKVVPFTEIVDAPQSYVGEEVVGTARVEEVVSDRGFWIVQDGQRIFTVLRENDPEIIDVNAGQQVRIAGFIETPTTFDRAVGGLEGETRRIALDQPVFLTVDERDVDILR